MYGMPPPDHGPKRPIVRPGTPSWQTGRLHRAPWLGAAVVLAIVAIAIIGCFLVVDGRVGLGLSVIVAPILATAVVAVAGTLAMRGNIVGPPKWRYEGVSIDGEALTLLADIQGRFDFARRLVDDVPAGLDWPEVSPHVEQLLWQAAADGARVSALDAEIAEFRYAATGTPQMALKKALEERRQEHWQAMRRIQTEADELARAAGNAAAAAKIALARTGDVRVLEVVMPSRRSIVAFDALSEARARLQLLADVWAELDESTSIAQEQIEAAADQDGNGRRSTTS